MIGKTRATSGWRPLLGAAAAALAVGVLMVPESADAHSRGFISFGFGFPLYSPPAYYYPPPAYYYPPPPVYYAPPPRVSYAEPPRTCREYQTQAMIDGQMQPLYGQACLQPDGSWRFER